MFRDAKVRVEDNRAILITAGDTVLNKARAPELCRVLEKIFRQRMGFDAEVRCRLTEEGPHKIHSSEVEEAVRMERQLVEKVTQAAEAAREEHRQAAVKNARAQEYRKRPPKGRLLDPEEGYVLVHLLPGLEDL